MKQGFSVEKFLGESTGDLLVPRDWESVLTVNEIPEGTIILWFTL